VSPRRVRVPGSRAVAAGLLLVALACGGPTQSAPGDASAGACTPDALWVASDYSSSAVGSLALGGAVSSTVGRVDLGTDPVLATSRGRGFLVARDADAVFELDPACGTPARRFDVHAGSRAGTADPTAVGVARDGSLWVPLYGAAALAVIAPSGDLATTIDLSAYDADGNPDASAIAIVDTTAGEKAFVALQRLNPYPASTQDSWMLRIDVATRAVETHLVLAGRNPFTVTADGATLWLAEPGNFDDAAEPQAGVERFDTATSTSALVVREADLGGSVAEVAVAGGCAAAIVADATTNVNATSLVAFDASTGAVLVPASASALATTGFDLEGLAWLGGTLAVGDRRRAASGYPVHAFDVASCAFTQRPDAVFLPLPPVGVRSAGP
jgi:hypothetical protein